MRYSVLITVLIFSGCLSREVTPTTRFKLEPEPRTATAGQRDDVTLAVRALEAGRPYSQKIVSVSGNELSYLPNVEWAEQPRDTVTKALTDALVACGRFADVGSPLDVKQPTWMLSGELRRFDLVREQDGWKTIAEVRIEVRQALGPRLIWADTLREEETLDERTVSAHAAAMERVVARMVSSAVEGIAKAV
jgi:ABC-type uncharacterized transport system auxiliary subunit